MVGEEVWIITESNNSTGYCSVIGVYSNRDQAIDLLEYMKENPITGCVYYIHTDIIL